MTKAEQAELRESWRERVAAFRASGLSGAAWCAANQVKEHQLWYWVRQFRVESTSPSSSPRFLPVQFREATATEAPLLVRVGKVAIEVHAGYDAELLLQLVRTLSALC
ncbi:hypothetical protein GCM10025857_31090 [Alicyclobacillus contaminans]|uniref:IS66 family insertion sequence element accessory protein TnpA n=1 Tax=Alicyclobacillus contaminans TaxID=392016 RepID=UPI00041996BF|nr:hypothetical protein [Alicyclobacillus contaminans]GMA49401.1 hypothetical protein GCM10025857_07580 [Alicyclobacillus contaminans]GMA51752.1 hypothetical protein GCM10025857_31090 [Alicyclobacillus contaminans]